MPGEGSSARISVVTVVALFVLWFAGHQPGLVKPLFLPTPQAVFQQFVEYLTGTANDKPLWSTSWPACCASSSAFLLAC